MCWLNEIFVATPGTSTYVSGTWTFPAEYVSFPAVVATMKSGISTITNIQRDDIPYFAFATEDINGDATATRLRFLVYDNMPGTASGHARCLAIGKWK